jgi:hypothetical protein
MTVHTELRLRSRVADSAIRESLAGKVLGAADFDVLLTGPARLIKPDGRPLCVYLPGALAAQVADPVTYDVLHSLRGMVTKNRGAASGTPRLDPTGRGRSYAAETPSMVVGAVDALGQQRYCRQTSWTARNLPYWQQLHPLLRAVAGHLAEHVPDRYANQAAQAAVSDAAWIVPGTPFSTVTVNNTYPTGVHTDRGDLDAGFSTIACLRRGPYTGGQLVFPAYRVAVDMHDGDLLLMDAHDWHGNTTIVCGCGERVRAPCESCGAERISVVSYFRTKIAQCGSPDEEYERAVRLREGQGGLTDVRTTASAPETAAAAG